MSCYLYSFCQLVEFLKLITDYILCSPNKKKLNKIFGRWDLFVDTYKIFATNCLKYLRNANEKVEQKELSKNISALCSITEEIIVYFQ